MLSAMSWIWIRAEETDGVSRQKIKVCMSMSHGWREDIEGCFTSTDESLISMGREDTGND